ncbi:helix-turn-helix domain-containing protein [Aliarcobacter lanthieri]|uniref:helix-turn-helix domain-containing protein n=1 Tax=Aliarcobacter lanthieri TaxID=1355374 RepID=UPI0004B9C556|nr:helix-turn-helix transcriptional regulator [Aliarcobacter lanthieri]
MKDFIFKINNIKYQCQYKVLTSDSSKIGVIIKGDENISNQIETVANRLYSEILKEYDLYNIVWFEFLDYGIKQQISKVEFEIYTKESFLNPKWEKIDNIPFGKERLFNLKLQEYLEPEINIIKKTCKEFNMTQKELAEKLGIKEQSLRNMTSSNKITEQVEKTINLLIENNELKKQLTDYNILKEVLKNLIK